MDPSEDIVSFLRPTRPTRAVESGSQPVGGVRELLAALRHLDLVLLGSVLGLTVFGLLLLFGSVAGSPALEAAAGRQVVWLGISLCALAVTLLVDYHWLQRLAPVLYAGNLVLLVLVLVIGTRVNGAMSWLRLGPFSFQPAETMKIVTVMMLASWFAHRPEGILRWRDLVAPAVLVLVPMALILKQPDLGTASLFVASFAALSFWAGIRRGILLTLVCGGLALAGGTYPFLKQYQKERVLTFLDPSRDPTGSGYNVLQSMVAVGSGGVAGRGFGEGTQAVHRYLPEAHTDFIFASAVEQVGLLGALAILGLYAAVFARFLRTVCLARDRFGGLMVVGLGAVMLGHVAFNTAMTVGLVPVTGIPLPFLSYGGSFLMSTYVLVGLVLNVSMRRYLFGAG